MYKIIVPCVNKTFHQREALGATNGRHKHSNRTENKEGQRESTAPIAHEHTDQCRWMVRAACCLFSLTCSARHCCSSSTCTDDTQTCTIHVTQPSHSTYIELMATCVCEIMLTLNTHAPIHCHVVLVCACV